MQMPNYLEKLLDGVEVEWKELETVVKTVTAPSKAKREAYREVGRLPIVDQGIEFIAGYTDEDFTPVKNGEYVIFGDHSEHIKYVDFSFVQGADGLKILKPIENNPKYIYYAFLNFYRKSLSYKRHWSKAKSTLIPIPCPNNPEKSLQIQREIVRILDTFTELTAELTAELNLRKQQYQYYRDQLLTFEEGEVEWKTLGEVLQMRAGQHISASKIMPNASNEHAYPCFGGNGIRGFVENKSHDGEHLLIGRQGALCGNVQRMKGQFYATEHAVVVTTSDEIDIDWAFHMLTAMNLNQYASQSAQPGLAVGKLQGLKIPVPSLVEQKRTAYILDKFDTLVNSLTEGLPREIELRQKQYEYYRDLLLSFPKPDAEEAA